MKHTTIIDLSEMDDFSEEDLMNLLQIWKNLPEGCGLDIINGGEEMENILKAVGFEHLQEDDEDGFLSLVESNPEEELIKKLPGYCRDILNRVECHTDAAVDEYDNIRGKIIYIADYYKKEVVIYWTDGDDMLAEYFLLRTLREKMNREGIESIHVNLKDARHEENQSYFKEDSLWKQIVYMER